MTKHILSYLLPFSEGDPRIICISPLLKVVHYHGGHCTCETSDRRFIGQISCPKNGDVQDTIFFLYGIRQLLKLHARYCKKKAYDVTWLLNHSDIHCNRQVNALSWVVSVM